ncbi:MAG TPA: transglycosylase SLT domain-containing protein [Rhodopila sp.]
MSRHVAHETSHRVRLIACLALLATLGACGSSHTHRPLAHYNPSRYYPPPGPASDPWGPYIREASGRFGVPELWIRSVMRQESGGQEDVISWAGAMGLMQVMPETYAGLRDRYNLGDDPFDPHNNILAGTAYLREMYDRFGSPGFLAAYNAGPNRLDRYLTEGTPLPSETVNYVASIAPRLGPGTPMSGPLAVYAGGAITTAQYAARPTPAGCDPDAAYNPDGPCTPLRPAEVQTVAMSAPAMVASTPYVGAPTPYVATPAPYVPTPEQYASGACDPDVAYDPSRPCQAPAPAPVVAEPIAPQARPPAPRPILRYATQSRPIQERMAQGVAFSPGPPPGHWMIQVGAFASLSTAENAAETARSAAPDLLRMTKIELPATTPFGNQVAFRARLSGLSAQAAAQACGRLSSHGMACMTVPPSRDAF